MLLFPCQTMKYVQIWPMSLFFLLTATCTMLRHHKLLMMFASMNYGTSLIPALELLSLLLVQLNLHAFFHETKTIQNTRFQILTLQILTLILFQTHITLSVMCWSLFWMWNECENTIKAPEVFYATRILYSSFFFVCFFVTNRSNFKSPVGFVSIVLNWWSFRPVCELD